MTEALPRRSAPLPPLCSTHPPNFPHSDARVVILNQLAHDLAIDLDAAGNVVSSYSLAYGLSAPFFAALTARIRKDRVVLAALAAFAIANALCAIAPSYTALIAARFLTGFAAGLYTPSG